MSRVGVLIVGSSGAVATTVIAGVALMKKGLAPRVGMLTESERFRGLDLPSIDDLVFGGWDLRADDAYTAAMSHGVVDRHQLHEVKEELSAVRPWPGVVSPRFLSSVSGNNVVVADT